MANTGPTDIDNGWVGQHQRPSEHQIELKPTIEMGARPYRADLGRFLRVDPIPGGATDSNYAYVEDPINTYDLNGMWGMPKWAKKALKVAAVVGGVAGAIACGVSVVCGAAVGAVAAAVSYTADNAGDCWTCEDTITASGFVSAVAVGGTVGALAAKFGVSKATKLRSKFNLSGGRGFRLAFDSKVHPSGRLGNLPHFQLDTWLKGVKGSGRRWRIPVPKSWLP